MNSQIRARLMLHFALQLFTGETCGSTRTAWWRLNVVPLVRLTPTLAQDHRYQ